MPSLLLELQAMHAKQTELETNLVIAQSNLALAENHAEALEDSIKRNSQMARISSGMGQQSGPAKRISGTRSPVPSQSSTLSSVADTDTDSNIPTAPSPRLGGFWRRAAAGASSVAKSSGMSSSSTSAGVSALLEPMTDASGRASASCDGSSDDDNPRTAAARLRKTSMGMLRSSSANVSGAVTKEDPRIVAALQTQLTNLQRKYSALEEEHAGLRNTHDTTSKRYAALQEEIENLSVSLFEEANTMVAEERRVNSFLNEQLDRAKAEVDELHKEIEQLKALGSESLDAATPLETRPASTSPTQSLRASSPTESLSRSLHRRSISSTASAFHSSTRSSRRRSSLPALEILEHVVQASPRRGSRDVAAAAAAVAALAQREYAHEVPNLPLSSARAFSDSSSAAVFTGDDVEQGKTSWFSFGSRRKLKAVDPAPAPTETAWASTSTSSPARRPRKRGLSRSQRSEESSQPSESAMSGADSDSVHSDRLADSDGDRSGTVSRPTPPVSRPASRTASSSTAASDTTPSIMYASQLNKSTLLSPHLEASPNVDKDPMTTPSPGLSQRERFFSSSSATPLASIQNVSNRLNSAIVEPRPNGAAGSNARSSADDSMLMDSTLIMGNGQAPELDELLDQIQHDVDVMGLGIQNSSLPFGQHRRDALKLSQPRSVSPVSSTSSDSQSLRNRNAWNVRTGSGDSGTSIRGGIRPVRLASEDRSAVSAAELPLSDTLPLHSPLASTSTLPFASGIDMARHHSADAVVPPRSRRMTPSNSSSSDRVDTSFSLQRPNAPSAISVPPWHAQNITNTQPQGLGIDLQRQTSESGNNDGESTPISPFPLPTPPPFRRFPDSNSYREPFYSPGLPPTSQNASPAKSAQNHVSQGKGVNTNNRSSKSSLSRIALGNNGYNTGSTSSSSIGSISTTGGQVGLTRSESNMSTLSTVSSLSRYLDNRNSARLERTASGFSVVEDLDTLMKSIDAMTDSLGLSEEEEE
ncbi:hypothetical protein EMMF5_004823 [Cystobasidiomycetes sp. EMM_F5]